MYLHEKKISMYDIIGDIHGHADTLERLLVKLGYQRVSGIYKHPEGRQVVYVGDFIDRGPKIRETLHVVRNMVEAGSAHAVMGNHEYNAVCFHTPHKEEGGFFRSHSVKEIEQHLETLRQFKDFPDEWESFLRWFQTLPMFLEFPAFNVVHAYWNPSHIAWLKENYQPDHGGLTGSFLSESCVKNSQAFKAVEETLKGPEIALPNGVFMVDKEGHQRSECRLKWWVSTKNNMGEGVMECPETEQSKPMPPGSDLSIYTAEKTVFFGHYWLKGNPKIENKSAICLDYSVAKHGKLVAYRFDAKHIIDSKNFIFI